MDKLIEKEGLRNFVADVFGKIGFLDPDCLTAADALVFADERGLRSHGVTNLCRLYVVQVRNGTIDPAAKPKLLVDEPAVALMDACGGLGLVVATKAMDLATEKAKSTGIAMVAVRNSTHFGPASFYSMRAQARGMIGVAISNLGSQVVAPPPDGAVAMLGTNPLSIAAPAGGLPAFAVDMSTTVVSTGKIRLAFEHGCSVATGWLVDGDTKDVTDPGRFFDGHAQLQMLGGRGATGGYKGYGLALAVDTLAGILASASVGPSPEVLATEKHFRNSYKRDIGHLFIAINIEALRPVSEFCAAMERMLGALLVCPSRSGCAPVAYPGYPEAFPYEPDLPNCVPVFTEDFRALTQLAEELNLTFPRIIAERKEKEKL